MICDIDLFTYPENLDDAKNIVKLLSDQINNVEALEHAKDRLAKTPRLDSHTLAKCGVFVHYFNQSALSSHFYLEVSELSLNELAFMAICFTETRLQGLLDSFKASDLRTYVEKQKVSCLQRPEILARLKNLSARFKESNFARLYEFVRGKTQPSDEPEPKTAVNDHEAFELLGASGENIENTFCEDFANNFRAALQSSAWGIARVRSRFPRARTGGDAFVSVDLGSSMSWVSSLFQGDGRRADVTEIPKILGVRIADALDKSELRRWEKRRGILSTTKCVQLSYHLELRICYDTDIADSLHSDNKEHPPI